MRAYLTTAGPYTTTYRLRETPAERYFVVSDGPVSPITPLHGRWWVPNDRPPVNPWRHAYTRSKHFRRAAQRLRMQYGQVAARGVISRPLYHAWQAAERACTRAAWDAAEGPR